MQDFIRKRPKLKLFDESTEDNNYKIDDEIENVDQDT